VGGKGCKGRRGEGYDGGVVKEGEEEWGEICVK